jgi:transketolase
MFNTESKHQTKMSEVAPQLASMRAGFGRGLIKAGELNKNVVVLCGDLAESTQVEGFRNKFPERFVEVGIAEQNLVTVAAGVAAMGKIPFAASYAVFNPGRNWEQIRTTICYNNLPVKIVGSHAGLNVGPDGGSHQALEDIALARVLPRMVVISPCDAIEAEKAAVACSQTKDPTYIRLAREKSPLITDEKTPFEIGKAQEVFRNDSKCDVAIIVTGHLVYEAIVAAKKMAGEGKKIVVLNLSTVKPLDEEKIFNIAHETRALVTVEDHQIAGGMGSAISEIAARHHPVPIAFIGVDDQFGQSGTAQELSEFYGLNSRNIIEAAKKILLRKS